jgi:hypothetical protein
MVPGYLALGKWDLDHWGMGFLALGSLAIFFGGGGGGGKFTVYNGKCTITTLKSHFSH